MGGQTENFGGTSSAAPLAAGILGLIFSANPALTAAEARQILKDSATPIDPVFDLASLENEVLVARHALPYRPPDFARPAKQEYDRNLEEGLYENTIIVAWGDHGYHLTDHGLWRKNTAYHISMRSPLIIKAPGVVGGRVAHQVVGNIDFYPTLLELTGVEKPDDVHLHGNSLVSLLNNPGAEWDNITYTCAKERYGLITEQYRFTVSENGPSLYDLKNDPHEWNNLGSHPEYTGLVKEFTEKLATVAWNSADGVPLVKAEPSEVAPNTANKKAGKKKPAKEWDWFGALDADGDGAVTEAEWLKHSQVKAKKKNKPYDEARQKESFAQYDENGDGLMTREELEKGGK